MRLLFLPLLLLAFTAGAQSLFVAGPMAGYVGRQHANIWVEAQENVTELALTYWPANDNAHSRTVPYDGKPGKRFNTALFKLDGLAPNTVYNYYVSAAAGTQKDAGAASFKTQPAQEAPDFSFLTGSCAANVLDTSIFTAMAHTQADFMLWLGDNWYLPDRIGDPQILWEGAHFVRSQPVMQPLWKAMNHYAIWDDHDFGPNNSDKDFKFKQDARKAFISYWANPSYGDKDKGIYTSFSYGDVNVYMMDDRWWRSNDRDAAYRKGRPNKKKLMFGDRQMDWLKRSLKESRATFNIIATGSQVLNGHNKYDCLYHYPAEYYELLDFLAENKIQGVIFLTGDRHHSEVVSLQRPNQYTLYDITISPFTSRIGRVTGSEATNPQRVQGTLVEDQNYGKISVTGPAGHRKLHLDILGLKGEKRAAWEILQKELSYDNN